MIKSSRADWNSPLAGRGRLVGFCQATEFAFISILGETEMPAAQKHLVLVVLPPPPPLLFFLSPFLLSLVFLTLNVGSSGMTAWFLLFYLGTRALPGYWVGVQVRVSQSSQVSEGEALSVRGRALHARGPGLWLMQCQHKAGRESQGPSVQREKVFS